jgi:RNase P/RNase MRP subunit POP5
MSKKRINVIRPTLRHKKRYVILKFIETNNYNSNNLLYKNLNKLNIYKIISKNFQKIYGLFQQVNANITILDYNLENKEVLIRVNREYLDKFIGSLLFIKNTQLPLFCILEIKNTIKNKKEKDV